MHRQRAEEIAQSADMKNVTYNGQSIYIQRVNERNDTARIFSLDDPQNEFEVQLATLNEEQ
ncbi:H-type small acid-soluble spore protein [Virgibacillus byunsanensis]|uniref:Small, acid-soluble spore protein H n=1 Tax=Virgibacillus byunsanensis TaxID=570945 RepID=A0ABW3LMX9_9BACI